MKKKLMCLALGVVAACSVAFSQVNINEQVNGTTFTGQVTGTGVAANATLRVGTMVSFTYSGVVYNFMVVTTPSSNPSNQLIRDMANAIGNGFNQTAVNIQGALANGTAVNRFGFNTGEYALQYVQNVPFDFGISAVLGVGAIAAAATARRKKEQALAV